MMTVLGVLGDAVQLVLSGTTGVGSMLSGLLNTGYNIYAGNRQYEEMCIIDSIEFVQELVGDDGGVDALFQMCIAEV